MYVNIYISFLIICQTCVECCFVVWYRASRFILLYYRHYNLFTCSITVCVHSLECAAEKKSVNTNRLRECFSQKINFLCDEYDKFPHQHLTQRHRNELVNILQTTFESIDLGRINFVFHLGSQNIGPSGSVDNVLASFQVMAGWKIGYTLSFKPMMVQVICAAIFFIELCLDVYLEKHWIAVLIKLATVGTASDLNYFRHFWVHEQIPKNNSSRLSPLADTDEVNSKRTAGFNQSRKSVTSFLLQ